MIPATEPCLQLIQRSYCYLRLCGIDNNTACQQLQSVLMQVDNIKLTQGEQQDRPWQALLDFAVMHSHPGAAALPRSLPLLRGHIHYPDLHS